MVMLRPSSRIADSTAALSFRTTLTRSSTALPISLWSASRPLKTRVNFTLVPTIQELEGVLDLEIEIMVRNFGPHLDFLHMHDVTVLPGAAGFFRQLVFVLAVIP